jgi:hypothetical protein
MRIVHVFAERSAPSTSTNRCCARRMVRTISALHRAELHFDDPRSER